MPKAEADRLLARHRLQAAAIAKAAADEIERLARQAPTGDVDGWFERVADQIVELIQVAFEVLTRLAGAFHEEYAAELGYEVRSALAEFDEGAVRTSLRVTGPVAFKQHLVITDDPDDSRRVMARRMAGATQRHTLAGDRDTTEATIEANDTIIGWRRVSDGDPCAWCAMLISRGAVYKSAKTATRVVGRGGKSRNRGKFAQAIGSSYHDGDGCTAVPVFEHEEDPEEVDELYEQWAHVTAGKSGKEALRVWRQYWDSRTGDSGDVQP